MSPKKKPQESTLYKRLKITFKMKREIIEKRKRGVSVADLARTYNRSTSTICTILKNKDKIMEVDASKGVIRISTQRLRILDDVERLLLIWINEKQLQGDTINESIICEKAKVIFADLVKKTPGSSTAGEEVQFKASRGWFEKFKRRTGIHSVVRHGEAASSDTKAAENFIADFKKLEDSEGYLPQQVFNCDETGLFWKKMPKRTYITAEENALPGHKPIKDRLTLLFCANASGDLKIKPLLIYHSETPRAFKKCKVQRSKLNVMWRSNKKAWVTRDIFTD
ncbi:tigger transposable element-derived protein 1-like [Colletes gigas]|uniref:tigger transposable element-derived protein 1-like n=1 Tax=Colletes gigas TaxID=935657 RepID=UPI001C9A42DC|nr:tigger transposable element-derived protein 1-like [Colletes gigas]